MNQLLNQIFKIILLGTLVNSVPTTAGAQNGTCFMLDSNGNPINLGSLCQNSSHSKPSDYNYQPYQQDNYRYPNTRAHKNQRGVYTIPIKSRRSGIPVIDVKFNDHYVFEMMLDTGASQIVITQQMADTLKVRHHETVYVSTPSSNHVAMSAGYVKSVGVSSQVSHHNSLVITAPTMDMGLLGQSFFSGYDMTIKSDVIEFRER